ncbi:MAG: 2-octaprenyl-6-methoxyphenyl hydroxylase [Alphaproteobacteria bacterium]|nr:2-octaprenyl-6-methoxyphenyl hydroxylase [Alphaproteobacteria bacterium]
MAKKNRLPTGSAAQADVLIGGAGFAGLALAIALRQGLGDAFRVAVADPMLSRGAPQDGRASAIAAAARRLFETVGVWDAVAGEAQPILDMVVTDSRLKDAVRPTFLTFEGEIEPGEPFAHMVENRLLIEALVARAKAEGVELRAEAVRDFHCRGAHDPHPDSPPFRGREDSRHGRPPHERGRNEAGVSNRIDVHLSGGETVSARLLVAADGARSAIRELAGIKSVSWEYGQSGIVTTVEHERDHHGRAEEHFLPAGPFAILPLKGRRSSIVWTEEAREAERIVALPDAEFHAELERRFGLKLGEIAAVGPRRAYPLGLMVARAFVGERVALVGDAAHVIHPIAGQGLNLGLRDVAALAEAIADAARLGLDAGGAGVLDRYQRWRRFDTMAMGIATDALNRLFSNNSDALRILRDVGLGLVDRAPPLKRMFIREAAGLTGEVPRLLKGEAL